MFTFKVFVQTLEIYIAKHDRRPHLLGRVRQGSTGRITNYNIMAVSLSFYSTSTQPIKFKYLYVLFIKALQAMIIQAILLPKVETFKVERY